MGDYIQIIGIVMSVLGGLVVLLLSIIGYFGMQWMRSIDTNLKCLPEIRVELAAMKVKVDQHTDKQDDFTGKQEDFGHRLADVEKHISNTERIAVLENSMKTLAMEIEKLRPHVHTLDTFTQNLSNKVALLEQQGKPGPR